MRLPSLVVTMSRSSLCGLTKSVITASPAVPTRRWLIWWRSLAMLQPAVPVTPFGNASSAVSHSSTPGCPGRSPPVALTSAGSPPTNGDRMRIECRL